MAHHLFRLWLRKGSPFTLRMEHNPPIEHDGGETVTHLYLAPPQAEVLRGWLDGEGCEYDLIPHERQTEEQTRERQTLLGMQRGERAWPSMACPTCTWFDPLLKGEPCGRAGWPDESVDVFGGTDIAAQALGDCPVKHVWEG